MATDLPGDLKPGDLVIFVSGPFTGYKAVVDELLPGRRSVRVLLKIFGREAPYEALPSEIQRTGPA